MELLPLNHFTRMLECRKNASQWSSSALKEVERKATDSNPMDDKVFRPFITLESCDNDLEFHVPTQSWCDLIIVNCGRIYLMIMIGNMADSFNCLSVVISPSEILPFGWQLY